MVFAPKYRGKILTGEYSGKNSRILRNGVASIWAPSCFHGSVGNGWDVVSKYIETQDVHHAKNASYICPGFVNATIGVFGASARLS